MRAVIVVLVFLVASGVISDNACFSQEDDSGVVVYGEAEVISSAESSSDLTGDSSLDPELTMAIEITGSRFGDSVVSETVNLSKERVITFANTTMNKGLTIVRVGENGDEYQVFGFDSPGQAVGKKLAPGSYKVYPDNLNRDFEIGKITATISLELTSMNSEEGE